MTNYEYIMVRFGELSTKGKNKKVFIQTLLKQIKWALKGFPQLTYQMRPDHIYITLHGGDSKEVAKRLQDVSGIHSFSFVCKVALDLEVMKETALELLKEEHGKTFKVRAKRADKRFPIHSDDINRAIAGRILSTTSWKVDVHHPDVLLSLTIREDAAYFFTNSIKGAGGYPLGVGGKAMMMMSGGIDSPVAAYLLMKRGVEIECIHFAAPPYTNAAVIDKIRDLCKKLNRYQRRITVHVVPFTELQLEIYRQSGESLAITVMRRMMYRISEALAKKRSCYAMANGESVGQVASQTLASMRTINAVTSYPVLRPLSILDKLEIIEIARRIDTYDISIRPYEDCCTIFDPKNPKTAPRIDEVEEIEAKWDYASMVEDCVRQTTSFVVEEEDEGNQYL